ncbi:hypothetical protein Taro_032085 [Colocasia esculenta]|uniref:Uncharacterized protein n=1 Tax=Colocasia esculenta TaxID=4460 RepID=A0A843W0V2_COLES|nr:hypothetical protein [Colocasia esculenta]
MVRTVALSRLQSSRGWTGTPSGIESLAELSWLDWDAEVRLLSSGRVRAGRSRRGGRRGPRS